MREGEPLRQKLALACRILAMEGHNDLTLGHVSARHPGTAVYWMKATGLGLEEVTPDDIVLLDLDGNKLWGQARPHNELPIHAEVYRARPDVMAVVHTHPVHATVFSAGDVPLRPITHEGILFYPDVPRFTQTTDLILTREQGEGVARALGQGRAVLLRNHGIVAVGSSVEEACMVAIYLEKAARAQLLAQALGRYTWTPDHEVPEKLAHTVSPRQLQRYWEYHVRKLRRWERQMGL